MKCSVIVFSQPDEIKNTIERCMFNAKTTIIRVNISKGLKISEHI